MEEYENEIIIEEKKETKGKKFNKNNLPVLLAIISIALTFLKGFFGIVLTYGTALIALTAIFYTGAVVTSLLSMYIIIFKKKRLEFSPEFLISILAIAIAFI